MNADILNSEKIYKISFFLKKKKREKGRKIKEDSYEIKKKKTCVILTAYFPVKTRKFAEK